MLSISGSVLTEASSAREWRIWQVLELLDNARWSGEWVPVSRTIAWSLHRLLATVHQQSRAERHCPLDTDRLRHRAWEPPSEDLAVVELRGQRLRHLAGPAGWESSRSSGNSWCRKISLMFEIAESLVLTVDTGRRWIKWAMKP